MEGVTERETQRKGKKNKWDSDRVTEQEGKRK